MHNHVPCIMTSADLKIRIPANALPYMCAKETVPVQSTRNTQQSVIT